MRGKTKQITYIEHIAQSKIEFLPILLWAERTFSCHYGLMNYIDVNMNERK